MGEFRKLSSRRWIETKERETEETKYWGRFKTRVRSVQEKSGGKDDDDAEEFGAPVTDVHCCPSEPYDYCVTGAAKVRIYNGSNGSLKKTITRFKEFAYGGCLRNDGKLLVAGGESSRIKVFDLVTGGQLREFKRHRAPVHCTRWSMNNVNVLSCSDDKTVRLWDVSTEAHVRCFTGHTDYVRSCVPSPLNVNVWITGSYDHTVRIWDSRADEHNGQAVSVNHGEPIEAVLALKGGSVLLSAGGNRVKVWDVLGRGRLIYEFSNHQKTITSLIMDGTNTRILSGSLDGIVKVHDMRTYEVVSQVKMSGPILSLGITKDNTKLVAGLTTGRVCVKYRTKTKSELNDFVENQDSQDSSKKPMAMSGTYRYFVRGGTAGPARDDLKISLDRRARLRPYDVELRKFNYIKALDRALSTRSPAIVVSMFEELDLRNGLEAALAKREDASLEPILAFLVKYITTPRFSSVLLTVCETILTLYTGSIGHSVIVDELFSKLQQRLQHEIQAQRQLFKLSGTLELILSSNNS